MMNFILKPAVYLMSRFKYRKKFLLVGILLVSSIMLMTFEICTTAMSLIDYSHHELYALNYTQKLVALYQNAQKFRELELSYLSGNTTVREPINTLQNTINDQLSEIDSYDKSVNQYLSSSGALKQLKAQWDKIKSNGLQSTVQEQFTLQKDFAQKILDLIGLIAATSGLTLDPDTDGYYLMDLTTAQFPSAVNQITLMRDIVMFNLMQLNPENKQRFIVATTTLSEVYLPTVVSELKKVTDYNVSLQPHYASFDDLVTQVNDFVHIANTAAASEITPAIAENVSKKATQTLDYAFKYYSIMMQDLETVLRARIHTNQNSLYFNVVLCAIVTLLLIYFLSAIYVSLDNSISNIIEGTDSMAKGELDKKITLETHDEMTMVADSFNTMQKTISDFITETQEVMASAVLGDLTKKISENDKQGYSKTLAEVLNKLIKVCQNLIKEVKISITTVNSAAKEIANGNMDLSTRTESQAASLQETSASLEELTATVKQNAENAKDANSLSAKASEIATQGGHVVTEVVTMMGDINSRSRRIVDIISVIDGIAFQTNILALNAAVEAARAGEQGRGFAVVATEVRNLAQRSATAAKEIKELIEDSVGKIDSGTKLVDQAGATMEQIVDSIKKVASIMGEITSASMQQSIGIEQVNQAVSQMDSLTQQNATLVNKAATTAQILEAQTQHMSDIIATFKVDEKSDFSMLKHSVKDEEEMPSQSLEGVGMENLSMIYDEEEKAKRSKSEPNRNPQSGDRWEEF
jgi:methyl-accepting chemotaxis protein